MTAEQWCWGEFEGNICDSRAMVLGRERGDGHFASVSGWKQRGDEYWHSACFPFFKKQFCSCVCGYFCLHICLCNCVCAELRPEEDIRSPRTVEPSVCAEDHSQSSGRAAISVCRGSFLVLGKSSLSSCCWAVAPVLFLFCSLGTQPKKWSLSH